MAGSLEIFLCSISPLQYGYFPGSHYVYCGCKSHHVLAVDVNINDQGINVQSAEHSYKFVMALLNAWRNACSPFRLNQAIVGNAWDKIKFKYTESHRHYHTLNHIEDMFRHFDTVKDRLNRPELVAMAIFFHDIIYEPKEKDNEEKSAELFLDFAKKIESKDNVFQDDINNVYNWIIETKRHETEVHRTPGKFGVDDLHYFLDMDMAILGSPHEVYKQYADDIRREYQHVPEQMFKQGRAAILRSFLKVPNVYATEVFRTQFENRARENISAEITRLEA